MKSKKSAAKIEVPKTLSRKIDAILDLIDELPQAVLSRESKRHIESGWGHMFDLQQDLYEAGL